MKKVKIVNKRIDKKIQAKTARKMNPQNLVTTNTRGGIRK